MIEVGNIVTLENQQEYLLLEELVKDTTKYVYAVRTVGDENITDEFVVFEVLVDGADEYLKIVDDKALYDGLIEEFREIVAEKLINADYSEFEEVEGEEE